MKTEIDVKPMNDISFFSRIENISIVEKMLDEISENMDISSEVYGNMLVAVIEAVNNAILHGNKLNPNKQVSVSFTNINEKVVFTIKDEGNGFNYNKIPDPTLPENIEKPHGRGVFLMKKLSDEIKYNTTGTEVSLIFNIK